MISRWFLPLILFFSVLAGNVFAEDLTSGSFKILAPAFFSNGFSSSNSFRMLGSLGQTGLGVSNSNNFKIHSGIQYYAAPSSGGGSTPPAPAPSPGSSGGPVLALFEYLYRLIVPCSGADLNCDGEVNIFDAGIMFYWWGQPLDEPEVASALSLLTSRGRPAPDFNKDKIVDIFDLSILLSYWVE